MTVQNGFCVRTVIRLSFVLPYGRHRRRKRFLACRGAYEPNNGENRSLETTVNTWEWPVAVSAKKCPSFTTAGTCAMCLARKSAAAVAGCSRSPPTRQTLPRSVSRLHTNSPVMARRSATWNAFVRFCFGCMFGCMFRLMGVAVRKSVSNVRTVTV